MAPFRVDPQLLRRASTRFAELAGDTATAQSFVASHDQMGAGGGLVGLILTRHSAVDNEMSASVQTADNMLGDWATNYTESAKAYEKSERDNVAELRRVWAELPDDPTDHHPYNYPSGTPHEMGSQLPSAQLHEPVQLDSALAIADVVNALINSAAERHAQSELFKWIFRTITHHDFDALLDDAFRMVIGDWAAGGLLASLYDSYADYFGGVGVCVRDASATVFDTWTGEAADYARAQSLDFGDRLFGLQSDIAEVSMRYAAACLGCYSLLADLAKLVDDAISGAQKVDEYLQLHLDQPLPVVLAEVGGAVLSVLGKCFEIVETVGLIVRVVKGLLELLMIVQAAFAGFHDRLPSPA